MLNIGIVGWTAQGLLGLSFGGAFFRWVSQQQLSTHCKQRTYEHEHEKEGILILPTQFFFFFLDFLTLNHQFETLLQGVASVDTPKMAKGGLIDFLSRRSSDVHSNL